MSHIHNILLFRVKFGLEVEGLGFPGSQYALFLAMLLYVIHFSSPVIIRFKKGSISFRASRDVHMTTRSSKFFQLNSCGTHLEYFHLLQSYLPNMVRNGLLSWIKPFCDLRCCPKRILLQHRRWSKMVAQRLIRKVEITCFKFFVPSSACPIRNCTFTKHFQ